MSIKAEIKCKSGYNQKPTNNTVRMTLEVFFLVASDHKQLVDVSGPQATWDFLMLNAHYFSWWLFMYVVGSRCPLFILSGSMSSPCNG